MIVLTRLNGEQFAINDEQIERMEAGHDTTLMLVTGNRYTVTETIDEIIDEIIRFRARVHAVLEDTDAHPLATIRPFRSLPTKPVTED